MFPFNYLLVKIRKKAGNKLTARFIVNIYFPPFIMVVDTVNE